YWPLEAALWDIIGKAAGQPVSALFGAAGTRLAAYASFGELKSPAERADAVLAARAAGFGAVKIRIDRADVAAGLGALGAAGSACALDGVQPDAVLAVGMLRARAIAEFAQLRHRWYTPHTWTNGLGLLANLHLAAGVGGGPYVEFPYDPPGWTERRRDFFLAQ